MHRSREGRHTAKASTWIMRAGLVKTREEAVKLVKRGRVLLNGKIAQPRYSYIRPKKIALRED